ncbi:MAG TPA: choice-of-anchor tandem repeat GloVer-containing protein, partial [Candidatus Acidoferrum sp.]|nr:choice-of-anchor tandem repeat GloVer-containing protein [Candidatus Acidoferrum sp.]
MHTFGLSQNDGAHPYATLTQFDGSLYGTTSSGGDYGGGTIYTIQNISGTLSYATMYSFGKTSADGTGPRGALLKVGNNLFGTTEYGGSQGGGNLYEIGSTGSETIVYSFGPGDAQNPIGNL